MITRVCLAVTYEHPDRVDKQWLDGLRWFSGLATVVIRVFILRRSGVERVLRKFTEEECAEACWSLDFITRKIREASTVGVEVLLSNQVIACS
jgi:hypothetical protein